MVRYRHFVSLPRNLMSLPLHKAWSSLSKRSSSWACFATLEVVACLRKGDCLLAAGFVEQDLTRAHGNPDSFVLEPGFFLESMKDGSMLGKYQFPFIVRLKVPADLRCCTARSC